MLLSYPSQLPRVAAKLIAIFAIFPLVGCASRAQLPAGDAKPAPVADDLVGGENWTSGDGEQFPFTAWAPKSNVKTVIVAVHGLSGAASDFEPLGEYLQERSTAVYSYELRGQGNDPKKKRIGDIKRPELWYADLDSFIKLVRASHPKARLFLYGESLGSLISIHGLDRLSESNREAIRGLILASPVVSLKDRKDIPRIKYAAMKTAMRILPKARLSLDALTADKKDMQLTGELSHEENLETTKHAVTSFSFRLLRVLEKMIDESKMAAAKIKKPILVIYPANDLLTTAADVEDWYEALETEDKEKRLFKESFHLLLYDKERPAVLQTIKGWLDRH